MEGGAGGGDKAGRDEEKDKAMEEELKHRRSIASSTICICVCIYTIIYCILLAWAGFDLVSGEVGVIAFDSLSNLSPFSGTFWSSGS